MGVRAEINALRWHDILCGLYHRSSIVCTHHPLLAILGRTSTAFCTYSVGSRDTLRHCPRARACRCGGNKSRALSQGPVFQLFVQMALWGTLGSGMDQHFAPELFAGTSKTTTFYKGYTMSLGTWYNITFYKLFEHVADLLLRFPQH